MSPVRAVITVPWARPVGGAEKILWTLLQHLDRSRVEALIVFFEAGEFEREVSDLGIRTHVIEAGRLRQPVRFVRTTRTLERLLRSEQPDVLLDWSAKTHLYGSFAAMLARVPKRTAWWQQG